MFPDPSGTERRDRTYYVFACANRRDLNDLPSWQLCHGFMVGWHAPAVHVFNTSLFCLGFGGLNVECLDVAQEPAGREGERRDVDDELTYKGHAKERTQQLCTPCIKHHRTAVKKCRSWHINARWVRKTTNHCKLTKGTLDHEGQNIMRYPCCNQRQVLI